MGLFVSKNTEQNHTYSLSSKTTLVIVGLGNIGKEYAGTRHNIGFECLDALQKAHHEFTLWQNKKTLNCLVSSGIFGQTKVILAKPSTYMNESGRATKALLDFYKIPISKLAVVHDELDIPFGQIMIRQGGGHAGHNGIRSIIQHTSDNFGRIRIGISKPLNSEQSNGANYVLAKFNKEQQHQIPKLIREVQSILIEYIYRGELYPETRNFLI